MGRKDTKKYLTSIQLTFYEHKKLALARFRPGHKSSFVNLSEENFSYLGELLQKDAQRYTRIRDSVYFNNDGIIIPTTSGQKLERFVRENFPLGKSPDGREYLEK